MARIEHRRYVAPRAAPPPETHAPDAALDNLTIVGWASAVLAVASLIVQLLPFANEGALSDGSRLNVLVVALRAVTASATIALPAAMELGLPDARNRAPWLYRGVVLLALAQAAIFGMNQLGDRIALGDDQANLANAIVLAFAVGKLAVAILQVAGIWSAGDGLGDLGARPRKAFLVGLPVLVALATLGVYLQYVIPAVQSAIENGDAAILVSLARLIVSLVLVAATVAFGVRMIEGGVQGLRPRRPWLTAWIAGACLIGALLVGVVLLLQQIGDLLVPASILSIVLEMLGWVLFASALAAGLGRASLVLVGPRRYLTRWVRTSA